MRYTRATFATVAVALLAVPVLAASHDRSDRPEREFRAELRGPNEVPSTLSGGHGTLKLTVNDADTSVHFVLDFTGIQTTVLFSHIHVGESKENGGVTVFFCGGGGRPACPQEGVVEGDFTANDVVALPTQQLEAKNLVKLLAAIRAGETYANLHSMTSPGGEIRGQIHADRDRDRDRK